MRIKNISLIVIATIISTASSFGMEKKKKVTREQKQQAQLSAMLMHHQNIEPNHEQEYINQMERMIQKQQEYEKPNNK